MNEEAHEPDFVMNPGEKTTILFMQMVMQLSSLASLLLGKVPHPETGETRRDLEAAQVVIDQLDMLETKTKGNLTREEQQMLRQTLMGLRMAYVDAVNHPQPQSSEPVGAAPTVQSPDSQPGSAPEGGSAEGAQSAGQAESKKRFSKKYET